MLRMVCRRYMWVCSRWIGIGLWVKVNAIQLYYNIIIQYRYLYMFVCGKKERFKIDFPLRYFFLSFFSIYLLLLLLLLYLRGWRWSLVWYFAKYNSQTSAKVHFLVLNIPKTGKDEFSRIRVKYFSNLIKVNLSNEKHTGKEICSLPNWMYNKRQGVWTFILILFFPRCSFIRWIQFVKPHGFRANQSATPSLWAQHICYENTNQRRMYEIHFLCRIHSWVYQLVRRKTICTTMFRILENAKTV